MPIVQHPLESLKQFIPENSFEYVVKYIQHYNIHFTVTQKRKTILGDYRHPLKHKNHRITVNGNLNKYEFLITFLHELAHLQTFEAFGNRVEPHGIEWKRNYSNLLVQFIQLQIFPGDVVKALQKSINNPSATASGETELLKVLRTYNTEIRVGFVTVENITTGSFFKTDKNRIFKKLEQRRKRFVCEEISTGRLYAFSPIAEVMPIQITSS
jgi:SprT protein